MSEAARSYANHVNFMKKPKKKFADARQKHHYVHAAKHYHSYRQEMKKKNYEKSDAHAHAFRQHAKAGKFSDWHRDQVQHDAKHFGEASASHFTPYRKKIKGKVLVKGLSRKQKLERYLMFQKQMNAGMKSGQRMRDAKAEGKEAKAKKHERRVKWHARRAKRHAAKIGVKLK